MKCAMPFKNGTPKQTPLRPLTPTVLDKRLLVLEPEFLALAVAERHGNVLRKCIDVPGTSGHKLSTLTKNSPLTATDPTSQ